MPYDQFGRPIEQSMQGGQGAPPGSQAPTEGVGDVQQAQQAHQTQPITEMSVSTPTLRWVSIETLQDQVPIGPDDYVLNSFYNQQIDAWEALVVVQPRGDEEEEEEDEE